MNKLSSAFKTPSAEVLAQRELEEARRQLLQAQSAAEYAQNLAAYHTQRIARLSAFLRNAA